MRFPSVHFSLKEMKPREEPCQIRNAPKELKPVEDPYWSRFTPEGTEIMGETQLSRENE